uniref:Choline transporter-like protein n=1 Tax=Oncorhynchus mykiss TaxID=8022 RepID=A0A8C7S3A0_ONCMY
MADVECVVSVLLLTLWELQGSDPGYTLKYDPTFKGPIYNRGCTDIVCCILFIICILGYVAVGILAWSQGDPRKVIYPTDSRGQFFLPSPFIHGGIRNGQSLTLTCILSSGLCPAMLTPSKPCKYGSSLFCSPILSTCPSSIPLSRTPQHSIWPAHPPQFRNLKKVKDIILAALPYCCVFSFTPLPLPPVTRRCFPALDQKKGGEITVGNNSKNATVVIEARQVAMKIFEDYTQSWYWILIGLVIAMLISLLFIILLRFLAGIMVWVMIVMVILVIGYGKNQFNRSPILSCFLMFISLYKLSIINKVISFIILAIVEVVIILLLIFLRNRILIAIALIKEASRAIGYVMSALFYPLFTFALLSIVIAYWAVTAVFLSTSNQPIYKVFNETACDHSRKICEPAVSPAECPDSKCLFAFYGGETVYHKYLIGLQFYNVFLFFWCANFVTALGQMTLAGAFASYYWAFVKPDDMPAFPIFSSLGRSLRYHTGSLAFGSLILSIIQIIRVLLEYIDHKLQGTQNKCTKFLLCCLKCCFWCLEKFIKFINRNAYIMVAIYGKNFCTSAKDAFFLLMRNMIRVAVLDKVTDFLLFLGKLLIVGLVGIFAFFFFSGRVKAFENTAPNLHYYWVPILTVVVGSYLIAHGFFSVYAMCVDTLFLCFLEDLERNDGSAERPYLMSDRLLKVLNKKNKPEPAE